uniref:E2F transcription factor-like E2FF n=1 Tax=Erigeron canadensis TaxID=72917 RepID=UPI001CB96357|nr:E2F transcription factor-like E2FF [Erigeron canadensis]
MTSHHDSVSKNTSSSCSIYSRKEKSLGVLCSNFLGLYNREGVDCIGLDNAANQLGVERRRIYDIVNILESVGVLTKRAKNQYTWKGFKAIPHALEELRKHASNDDNYKGSQYCNFGTVVNDSLGPSDSNNSNTDKLTKSSGSSKSETIRKEKSLGLLTQNFIKLFITSDADVITLDTAATMLLGDLHDPTAMRTKVRRLYDIANVFSSMNLLQKMRHPESGKPAFRWLGLKEPKTKPIILATDNSKRRAFGTDITNSCGLKRNRNDSLSGWCSKDATVAVDGNIDCDENITMQKQLPLQRNSKEFVFGPFTPVTGTAHKVGSSGNKKLKQAPEWENLADTYRPRYLNKALNDVFGHYAEAWKSWYVESADKKQVRPVT